MSKFIWATDLAQFDVNDETLEKFKKFDTFNEAIQDAIDHFRWASCDDVTNYIAEHNITIYVAELVYNDLTQQNYFYQILTDMEEIARQDYHHDDLEIVPSDPYSDIMIKYNDRLKKLLDGYLFEIGKKDGAIYPNLTNIYQYSSDGTIWKMTHESIEINKWYINRK